MFRIELSQTSKKFLEKVERKEAEIILRKIFDLRDNPFRFLKRLHGERLWRLRISDYRAVVDVIISANRIIVLRIGHRKNVYD